MFSVYEVKNSVQLCTEFFCYAKNPAACKFCKPRDFTFFQPKYVSPSRMACPFHSTHTRSSIHIKNAPGIMVSTASTIHTTSFFTTPFTTRQMPKKFQVRVCTVSLWQAGEARLPPSKNRSFNAPLRLFNYFAAILPPCAAHLCPPCGGAFAYIYYIPILIMRKYFGQKFFGSAK